MALVWKPHSIKQISSAYKKKKICNFYPFFLLFPLNCFALDSQDLINLSLEELANLDISSASKKEVPLSQTPTALYVITAEDIRRSGATNIPEILSLAPNLLVARIDAINYAVSARGFNDTFSNKLQVLIDGRSVYTPLFSGVFWALQVIRPQDIEQIEVISGPASTAWGANAVNGVINIITRNASQTQGSEITARLGTMESNLSLRYGSEFAQNVHYRVFANLTDRDGSTMATGVDRHEDWDHQQVGFRADWQDGADSYQLQGDFYQGRVDWLLTDNFNTKGNNLMLHWDRNLDADASLSLVAYSSFTELDYPDGFFERRRTSHLELVHRLAPNKNHQLQWGLEYRYSSDETKNSPTLAFVPAKQNLSWASLFLQDQFRISDEFSMTVGIRAEHNDYTGLEWMPTGKLAWQPDKEQLIWVSYSHAIRSPSRFDKDIVSPGSPPYLVNGGPTFRSETADVYEMGYRALWTKSLFGSVVAYYARYNYLRTLEYLETQVVEVSNGLRGNAVGLEAWLNYQVQDNWRLSAGWTAMRQNFAFRETSSLMNIEWSQGNSPSHQWQLRSQWDFAENKELDIIIRRTGALPNPEVPSYTTTDVRFGWNISPQLQWSVVVKNLFNDRHAEFGSEPERSVFNRSANLSLNWRF